MHISADFHSCKATEAVATCWRAPFTGAGTSFFVEDQRHLESNKHTVVFVGDFVVIKLRNYKSYKNLQLQPFNHDAKGRDWYITPAMAPSFFVLFVVKSRLSRLNHAWLGNASCMKTVLVPHVGDGRHISIDCNCPRATGLLERFRWYGGIESTFIIEAYPGSMNLQLTMGGSIRNGDRSLLNNSEIYQTGWWRHSFDIHTFKLEVPGVSERLSNESTWKPTLMDIDGFFVRGANIWYTFISFRRGKKPLSLQSTSMKEARCHMVVDRWRKKDKPMLNPVQLPLDDKLEL